MIIMNKQRQVAAILAGARAALDAAGNGNDDNDDNCHIYIIIITPIM